MKSAISILALALTVASCLGFVAVQPSITSRRPTSTITAVDMMMPPAVEHVALQQQQQQHISPSSTMHQGINNYMASSSSSTQLISLKERHIPTPEEVAAKKRNFNLLFWGGGFVAPFVATVFYFGFRFWEK